MAVCKVPVTLVAVMSPEPKLISLLASTTKALEATAVPAVAPSNTLSSAEVVVTKTPPSLRPLVPSCEAISKSFEPSAIVASPPTVRPVKVPTVVIAPCEAV